MLRVDVLHRLRDDGPYDVCSRVDWISVICWAFGELVANCVLDRGNDGVDGFPLLAACKGWPHGTYRHRRPHSFGMVALAYVRHSPNPRFCTDFHP